MISVIVPVYKTEAYLPQCIDSILRQTYRDLEILLIDDGSPDNCGGICEEYARSDTRIRVFHTENKGLSAARNLGLREAKGEYIGFVDSDDWLEPDMYEILLRRLEETGTNISACGVRSEYQDRSYDYSIRDAVYIGTEATKVIACNFSTATWNKLYKKTIWTGISFPESSTYEDAAILCKVVLKAGSMSCVPKPLYHYRMRVGSIVHTRSMKNSMDCWNAIYNRYLYLCALPEFNEDHQFVDLLEKLVAHTAVKIWIWMYMVPKEQRDYDFLHMVSGFVQKKYPFFGKKNWGLPLRTGIFFTRYPNDFSLKAVHILYAFSTFFVKDTNESLFPSE